MAMNLADLLTYTVLVNRKSAGPGVRETHALVQDPPLTCWVTLANCFPISTSVPLPARWEYCHPIHRVVIRTKKHVRGNCTHWTKVKC